MEFGNGALLAGMALGLIPIIIHLINRHRAKLVQFAAIEFLLMSDKRLARRLKLKQLLVLALRVLLLMLMAFALAKPYVAPDALPAPDAGAPGALALVIDDSMSMQALGLDGKSRLSRALDRAREIVGAGGSRTSFAVIASGEPARVLTKELTYDQAAARRALDRVKPVARGGDLHGALKEAGRLLSSASETRRMIYVIGDGAAHGWEQLSWPWSWVPVNGVELIDVTEEVPIDNVAIVGVDVVRTGEGAKSALEIDVDVQNFSDNRATRTITAKVGDGIVAERTELAAGSRVRVPLRLRVGRDVSRGVVQLDADALEADDSWYFTVDQRHAVNVLVVNGAPRAEVYFDELFFLRAALSVSHAEDTALNPAYVSVEELTPARINPMDVVILANVGTLSPPQHLALRNFVDGGGGLLITSGDQLTAESAKTYKSLIPFEIRGQKTIADASDPASALAALSIATVDFAHPIIDVFDGVEDASLFKARVYSYLLLDTVGRPGAKVVASYTGGIPALVEGSVGRGRILMLTTTMDRDWSDLSLRSSFLPLVQRMCQYLARTLDSDGGVGFVVGRPQRVALPEGTGALALSRPDGGESIIDETPDDTIAGSVYISETDVAGHYILSRRGDLRRAVSFALNADRSESDLAQAEPAVIEAVVTELTQNNGILPDIDGPVEDVLSAAGVDRGGTLLWPYILAGLFLLVGAEAWLVLRN